MEEVMIKEESASVRTYKISGLIHADLCDALTAHNMTIPQAAAKSGMTESEFNDLLFLEKIPCVFTEQAKEFLLKLTAKESIDALFPDYLRCNGKRAQRIELYEDPANGDTNKSDIQIIVSRQIRRAFSTHLNLRERLIIEQYYFKGYSSLKQLAWDLDVPLLEVELIHDTAMNKLKGDSKLGMLHRVITEAENLAIA